MPRQRRKTKAVSANKDNNRSSQSTSLLSSSKPQSENVKHVSTTGSKKRKNLTETTTSNDSSISVSNERSNDSSVASSADTRSSSSSFWSPSPAKKISDVGAAIKRKLKQNFGVSFLLDPSPDDHDQSNCRQFSGGKTSASMNDVHSRSNDYYLPPYGPVIRPVPSANTLNRLDRQEIVIWRRPFKTLKFFVLELACLIHENTLKLWSHRLYVILAIITSLLAYFAYGLPGPHQTAIHYLEKKLFWCAYWIGLGVLSSVGLGTGLHTFLLYLGPHIASVTLAAYECHSLKFPEPPYPDQIICPVSTSATSNLPPNSSNFADQQQRQVHSAGLDDVSSTLSSMVAATAAISLWQIMYKVALESFMWGAGTALGELPPYFMARAARLSGQEPDDEEYQEYIQFIHSTSQPEEQNFLTRGKMFVEKLVEYAGFWGILACASIPNPFFDLAGITCGHFLVPFATFFMATLIGKAIIKMTIQQVFIILAFSEHHMEAMVNRIMYIPIVGKWLHTPFKEFLKQQKTKLHRKPGDPVPNKSSLLGKLFEMIVVVMIGFFVVSLVNSLAQNYHRRQWQARKRELEAKLH